jgi:hypothetical protein
LAQCGNWPIGCAGAPSKQSGSNPRSIRTGPVDDARLTLHHDGGADPANLARPPPQPARWPPHGRGVWLSESDTLRLVEVNVLAALTTGPKASARIMREIHALIADGCPLSLKMTVCDHAVTVAQQLRDAIQGVKPPSYLRSETPADGTRPMGPDPKRANLLCEGSQMRERTRRHGERASISRAHPGMRVCAYARAAAPRRARSRRVRVCLCVKQEW